MYALRCARGFFFPFSPFSSNYFAPAFFRFSVPFRFVLFRFVASPFFSFSNDIEVQRHRHIHIHPSQLYAPHLISDLFLLLFSPSLLVSVLSVSLFSRAAIYLRIHVQYYPAPLCSVPSALLRATLSICLPVRLSARPSVPPSVCLVYGRREVSRLSQPTLSVSAALPFPSPSARARPSPNPLLDSIHEAS